MNTLDINVLRRKSILKNISTYAVLGIFALIFLIPIYVLLNTGLKSFKDVNVDTMWIPAATLSLEAFKKAALKLLPNLLNSFILTIPAALISALIGSINGYVFSKWKFKYSDILFTLMLFGMFIPYQSILVPLVQFLNKIGLYGNRWGLMVTHIIYGLPITTLIFKNYYGDVPTELIESGLMDGLGILSAYRRIVFPVSLPAFVVVIIWQFTNIWNEFLFAVTLTQNPAQQPITVALQNLAGSQIVEWNVQMAGALIAALPTLLVYIILGKFFIRGLLAGTVKG